MNVLHLQLTGNPGGIVSLCYSIARHSKNSNHMYFLFEGGTVQRSMEKEGIPTYVANANQYFWAKSKKELVKYCRDNNIDVIINHSNSPIACSHILEVKNIIPNVKVISYLHANANDMVNSLKRQIIYKSYIKRVQKKSSSIVAISNYVKNTAIEVFGLKNEDVTVIHNGVDYDYFSSYKKNRGKDVLELIYVGRLYKPKGVGLLIEALSIMSNDFPVKLKVVGRGPQQKELEDLAQKLKVTDKVQFFGLRMDVPELLGKSHFFVHPATLEEGFGITLIEAMSEGIPCVAFDKGAIPEIIDDEENGFIIKEVSVESLSKTIEKCFETIKNDEYEKMSNKASETGRKFDIKIMVEKLELLYQ